MQPNWFLDLCITEDMTLREGIEIMNRTGHQFLMIVDDKRVLVGVVTDGDIRRGIAKGLSLETKVGEIMSVKPVVLHSPVEEAKALDLIKTKMVRYLPVVDENHRVCDLVSWQDFLIERPIEEAIRPEPVVIMAGGKGTRLDPFTRILPKPLIPFGEKPMIEWIMDNFAQQGFKKFWLTLNYKKEAIKNYFSGIEKNYSIGFVEEDQPLGTAGSLHLLREYLTDTFIVTNCDVVLEENFSAIINKHKRESRLITIVAAEKKLQIPYGVLEIKEETLRDIKEKPQMTYFISGGVYILSPAALDYIEENKSIEMPELIKKINNRASNKIGVYITKNTWFDIGQWEDYQAALLSISNVI